MTRFPGEPLGRQPVHTVYGGAHLFKKDTALKLKEIAIKHYQTYAPNSDKLAQALNLSQDNGLAEKVFQRVLRKLETDPVEDFRIDFEDGFGNRPDAEEDETAVTAATAVADLS